ncbi:hypothetical protein ACP70R_030940 [Stipagrostis hirtigluma subsp. patula]
MVKEATARILAAGGASGPGVGQKIPVEERIAALEFVKAALREVERFVDTPDEDIVEEYRRAGRLHTYDPDNEWKKRYARAAKACPPPKFMLINQELDEYLGYLEEDEDDYRIGLCAASAWISLGD